jgi:NAD(P)-dependent dehydrogenase (short-subunit alcohol dehydrogenase family)
MHKSVSDTGKILITGGTSGLGLALVHYFLNKSWEVVATGRKNVTKSDSGGRFSFVMTDFSNLKQTSDAVKEICGNHDFDIVINNAGVLSPPDFLLTDNGLEYTFQVNFLTHLLLDEIILRKAEPGRPLMIAAIVSPVYRIAESDLKIHAKDTGYRPFKAYSNSKLYLALMCSHLSRKYPSLDLRCFGFDPGVFSSGIYRMQKGWFRMLYRIAAPFMRSPEKIAVRFGELTEWEDIVNGAIYRSGKQKGSVPVIDNQANNNFWQECYKIIKPYLD